MQTTNKTLKKLITIQSETHLLLYKINRIFYLARERVPNIDNFHLVIKVANDGNKRFRIEPGKLKSIAPDEIWISFKQQQGKDRKNNIFT